MPHEREGPEVARSDETSVGTEIRLWSDKSQKVVAALPLANGELRHRTAIAVNLAGGCALAILLIWANGRYSGSVATALLAVVGIILMAWYILQHAQASVQHEQELSESKAEVARLAAINSEYKLQIDRAYRRGSEINERSMRRIGADLHDGPAQLIGLVLLKLDELSPHLNKVGDPDGLETLELIQRVAREALTEIRNTARGLVLPEIEQVSLAAALTLAVKHHEQRTKTAVKADIGTLPQHIGLPITISLFRFAQEGLNNAFRHAGGKGQKLSASHDGAAIIVEISDDGAGFDPASLEQARDKLGLIGLKHRIEALGGIFDLKSSPQSGTKLCARFDLRPASKNPADSRAKR